MSHIVVIRTEIRDAVALTAACRRRQLPPPNQGSYRLYTSTVAGWGVQLPDWRFPIVCQMDTGQLQFDNFQGRWGDQEHLDRFLQAYAVEMATLQARRQGYSIQEQPLPDGSIKLSVQIAGAS